MKPIYMLSRSRIKMIFRPAKDFVKYRIFHIDDSPHRIALGVALGFFVAYQPLLGLHVILVLLLSWIFRANKAVAFVCSWLCNPFTIIPIYFPSYLLGRGVIGFLSDIPPANSKEIARMLRSSFSFKHIVTDIGTLEFWSELASLSAKIGLELYTGCFLAGTLIGLSGYFVTYRLLVCYRKKHPHLKLKH